MFGIEKTLLLARAAYKSGYIKEAKELYKRLLFLQPNHSIAIKEFKNIT